MFERGRIAQKSIGIQFLFFIALTIVCFSIVSLISMLCIPLLFNISLLKLQFILANLQEPNTVPILKFLQASQAVGLFILPPLVFSFFYSKSNNEIIFFNRPKRPIDWAFATLLVFSTIPLIAYTAQINEQFNLTEELKFIIEWMRNSEEQAAKITEYFLQTSTVGGLIINLLIMAVAAAIGEELFFRGIIQKLIINKTQKIHFSIWITALLFSFFHFQFFGFLPRMLLGVVLGYAYVFSGSIWIPIWIHFLNNGMAVVGDYLYRNNYITIDINKTPDMPILLVLASIGITFFMLLLMKKRN